MTIRARVVLTLTLSGLILFGIYALYTYRAEREHLERDDARELTLLTRSLRVAIENALRDGQIADVDETLDRLVELQPSISVIVYDATGTRAVASSGGGLTDGELDQAVARAIADGSEEATFEGGDRPRRLILAAPLLDDSGAPLGAISVSRPLDDLTDALDRTRRDIAITVAIFVLVAGALAFVTTTAYVRGPLTRVVGAMREIRSGHYEAELPTARLDEIGEVAAEFNLMARALDEAQHRAEVESEARIELERSLTRIDKMVTVGQLAAGLAHEIGSPLQVLLGRARAMTSSSDPEVRRNATTLVEQSERITRVVDQLLSYAKRRPPRREPLKLEQPVRTILDLIESEARRRGVTLELTVDAPDARIDADADQMQQVVLNLVSNALAVSRRGGAVRVHLDTTEVADATGRNRAMVRMTVEDSGPGISEEVRAKLFEPFFTTRAAEGGTGLGLAVVRSIVIEHGGAVTASSTPGVGARFEVTLPRATEASHG